MVYLLKKNDMVNINMLSNNFAHDKGATAHKPPTKIKWSFNSYENDISVYIDNDFFKLMNSKSKNKKNFLWLLESKYFDGGSSINVIKHLDFIVENFEQVWTHNDELLGTHPIFKWCPAYGSYIKDFNLHKKTKLISMVTSDKMLTEQHKFRKKFADDNKNFLDLYGRGFNEIKYKEYGLNDYMFSVAIENGTYDTYFTEKILDCFATGTIPIYMGTKKIKEYFNPDGILFLDEIDIKNITPELYYSKMDSIKENFEIAQKYSIIDDWIYDKYIVHFIQ